ncbi:reverse transcriptase [Apostichopus japonicus]|uniref:Reverse transcriptase n=1 Tax=Stichopus japonicus TaxID=307972 RepID=A0A2G8K7E2_STIJA|nr:reverse transcriptase [Apostichopus japonicus]
MVNNKLILIRNDNSNRGTLCTIGTNENSIDLPVAFDTVDHLQLLSTLSDLCVRSSALKWMTSYLSDRHQIVCLGKDSSDPQTLECGVAQGSVLGPVLFTVYTSSLGQLLRSQDMDYHFYADDSSLYLMFHPNDITITVHRLEKCITSVRQWMSQRLRCF